MVEQIKLGHIMIEVEKKDIKNLHLNVYPPHGSVRISAPKRMNLDHIRSFAISKLSWIKQQQQKLRKQARETPREYTDRESHYLWGQRYLLKVIESESISPTVELKYRKIHLYVRSGTPDEKKQALIDAWYRTQLKEAIIPLVAKWESIIDVKVEQFFIQRMKTKWGSCNPTSKYIRFNTELAKKSKEFLEYIVVHEMVHLLEHTHNHRFVSLMDQFMPKWRFYKEELNQSLLGHEQWKY